MASISKALRACSFRVCLPESHGLIEPAFRNGARAQAKAMRQARVMVELRGDAQRVHRRQPPLHGLPVGDAVVLTDAGKGRRVARSIVRMAGVLHDDRRRAGVIAFSESLRAVRAEPRRHARASRAAPEGIAVGIYFQLLRVFKDEADGARQILAGRLRASLDGK